ncbi:Xaa-Pro peptidase family protein [Lactococcus lactis subsp. lactis]|uniref:aminopeptidase P family protein n=1 Tax=Lactococcus lactis TaxID=1358 RepID=UPI00338E9ECC
MRIEKLKAKMLTENIDSLLITDMKNIFYLTGFSGTAGTVFLTAKRNIFMTDSRYSEMARGLISDFEIIETRDPISLLTDLSASESIKNIAFEETVDYAFFKRLSDATPGLELLATSNLVLELRQFKDDTEIDLIKKACAIADEAFMSALKFIEPGRTEIEVANFLDFKMRDLEASGISFETIVASGKRSSLPHGVATSKMIQFGDPVTIDFGCYYEHYASDMTRTIFVGSVDDKMRTIYETVRKANEALIKEVKAGMTYAEYDKVPRTVIEEANFGQYFTHGIGHGLGLDVHEIPYFNQSMTENHLEAGMVITDEPGIYIPEFGGVRIEDDLLVTENGCEVLTKAPKELIVI